MNKNIITKGVAFSIIIFFIGANVLPILNSEISNENSNFLASAENLSRGNTLDNRNIVFQEAGDRNDRDNIYDDEDIILYSGSSDPNITTYLVTTNNENVDTIVCHLQTSALSVDFSDNITIEICGNHHTRGYVIEKYVCGFDDAQDVGGDGACHDSIYITSLPFNIVEIYITLNSHNSYPLVEAGSWIELKDADKQIYMSRESGDYYVPHTAGNWYEDNFHFAQTAQAWIFAHGYNWPPRERSDLQVFNSKHFSPLDHVSPNRKADIIFGVSYNGTADVNSAWPGVGEYGYYLGAGISAGHPVYGRLAQQRLARGGSIMDAQAYLDDIAGTITTTLIGEAVEEAIGFPFAGEMIDVIQFIGTLTTTDETMANATKIRFMDVKLDPNQKYYFWIKAWQAVRAGGVGTSYVNFCFSGDPFTDLNKINDHQKGIRLHNALIYYHPAKLPGISLEKPTQKLYRPGDSIYFKSKVEWGEPPYELDWIKTRKNRTTHEIESTEVFQNSYTYDIEFDFNMNDFGADEYLITVALTDNSGGTDSDSCAISVLPPPNPPSVTITHDQIHVDNPYSINWERGDLDLCYSYRVEVKKEGYSSWADLPKQNWTHRTFINGDEDSETTIRYRVIAYNMLDDSSVPSNEVEIFIKRRQIDAPNILDLEDKYGSNQVYSVHWERGEGWIDGWQLNEYKWVNLTGGDTCELEKILVSEQLIEDDCPNEYTTEENITYCHCDGISYEVEETEVYEYELAQMDNISGNWYAGTWSRNVSTEIVPAPTLPPILLTPTNTVAPDIYYNIEWRGNDGLADDYYMQEDTDPNFSNPESRWLSNTTNFTYYKHTSSESGTYYYRICFVNNVRGYYFLFGPWSNTISKIVEPSGTQPGIPILSSSDSVVDSEQDYSISWERIDGEQVYQVQEAPTKGFKDSETTEWFTNGLGELPPISFTRSYSKVSTQSYFYRVQGLAAGASEGEWSNVVEVQVIGSNAPPTPYMLDPGSIMSRNQTYDLTWNPIPNTWLEFQESTDPSFINQLDHGYATIDGSCSKLSDQHGLLKHNPDVTTNYYYRLRSINDYGYSRWSNIVNMQILVPDYTSIPIPNAPSFVFPPNNTVLPVGQVYVNIGWTQSAGASFYILQFGENWYGDISWSECLDAYNGPNTSSKFYDPWLLPRNDTPRVFRVKAGNPCGFSDWSETLHVIFRPPEPPPPSQFPPPGLAFPGPIDDFHWFKSGVELMLGSNLYSAFEGKLGRSFLQDTINSNAANMVTHIGGRDSTEQTKGMRNLIGASFADYDNDSNLDLAIIEDNETVLVYNKDGAVIQSFTNLNNPIGVCIGDYDDDNQNDIAISEHYGGVVKIYNNLGQKIEEFIELRWPTGVSIGDFNNDGSNDIAIAEYGIGRITIFDNNKTTIGFFSNIHNPVSIAINDYNHNGYNDLAVFNESGKVSIIFGIIDNCSNENTSIEIYNPYNDFNVNKSALYLPLPQRSDTDFKGVGYENLFFNLIEPFGIKLADLDQDGYRDISNIEGSNVDIYNRFGEIIRSIEYLPSPFDVSLADFDYGEGEETFYFEDFDWDDGSYIPNEHPGWEWGIATSGPSGAPTLWGTVLDGEYMPEVSWTLDSPPIYDTDCLNTLELRFMHWYEIEWHYDGGNVKVSNDGGNNWEIVEPLGGYPCEAADNNNMGIPGEPCFSGMYGDWFYDGFDLTSYLGSEDGIMIRWHFGSDYMIQGAGWFIDDIELIGNGETEISISLPIGRLKTYNCKGIHMSGYSFYFDDPRGVSIGDFDGDGANDLAIAESNKITIINRNGQILKELPGFSDPRGVSIYNFNNDGLNDVACIDSDEIHVYYEQSPPYRPSNSNPIDYETNVSILINLSWTCEDPDEDPLTYDIYLGAANPPPLIESEYSSISYDPGELDYDTTYYWKIIARDDNGATTPSRLQTFETKENTPSTMPYNQTPEHGEIDVSILIELRWDGGDPDPENTVTYDVYFGENNQPQLISENQSETSFVLGLLNSSTTYYWKIIARDNHNITTSSPVWHFTTEPDIPPEWQNQGQNKTNIQVGESILLYAQGRDNVALDWAWLATNETGEWQNFTWWNNDWDYRKQIIIDHTNVEADLTGFPVLISHTSSDFANHAQHDGDDFVFLDNTDTFVYDHEVESYNSTSGELVAWVNVTYLSTTEDTIVNCYYGNENCASQENAEGVWDSSYVIVQHLEEDGTGMRYDSTRYDNDGTPINYDGDEAITGKIDGADDFDGSNDYITIADSSSLQSPITEVTLEAWIKCTDVTIYRDIISKQENAAKPNLGSWDVYVKQATGNVRFVIAKGASYVYSTSVESVNDGKWHYIVCKWDKSDAYLDIFIDGVEASYSNHATWNQDLSYGSFPVNIGRRADGLYFKGTIDEVSISNINKNSQWISTSYNTMNDPANFTTFGSEESQIYDSPMKMQENDQWQWSNFTWQNASVPIGTVVGWKIYYQDTSGNTNSTDVMSFIVNPDEILLEGDCYYQNMSPVDPVEVEIINLDTRSRWQAGIVNNHYSLVLLPGENVNASEILRIIARDDNESVNVTDYTVTGADISTGLIQLDLILDIHYRDLKDYPWYLQTVDSGTAVMKMMMDYLMWNSTTHPGGPPDVYSEQTLYDTYSGGDGINGSELWMGLNEEIDDHGHGWIYGYFFNPAHDPSADEVLKRICVWLDYPVDYYNDAREVDVPKPGHPNHVPIAIPAYGDYDNWMSVRGIHTDQNCWPPGEIVDLNVYGFWLNDPASGGVGENTYVTVQRFLDTYFFQLDVPGDRYDGKFLAITDPPRDIDVEIPDTKVSFAETSAELANQELDTLEQERTNPGSTDDSANKIILKAAFDQAYDILQNDVVYGELFEHAKATGKPVYSNGEYTVIFRNSGVTFTITLSKHADLLEIHIDHQSWNNLKDTKI